MTKKNHRLFVVVAFTALSVMAQAQMLPSKLLGHEQQIDDIIKGMTPAINIQRIPTGGRTYEYLSEDPLLSGMLSLRLLKGGMPDHRRTQRNSRGRSPSAAILNILGCKL